MKLTHGFSLAEVLVALCLISSTAMSLLTHQWEGTRLLNQTFIDFQSFLKSVNIVEAS